MKRASRRAIAAFCALAAMAGSPALSEQVDWEVSLAGEVELSEVRLGRSETWTCTLGSKTADAANGSCSTDSGVGGSSWTSRPPGRMPQIVFVVKPTFEISGLPSPTGIPGATYRVACGVPAAPQAPGPESMWDNDGAMDDGSDLMAGLQQEMGATKYCGYVKLQSDGGSGNAWTIAYDGPTDSAALRQ